MRYPTLRSAGAMALRHVVAAAGALALTAAQAQDGPPRKGAIRAGCGTLSDSQGRAVAQQSDTEREVSRPAHCPEALAAPTATVLAPAPAAATLMPAAEPPPATAEAPPQASAPVRTRPKPPARPVQRSASPAPAVPAPPAPARQVHLESSRTTYAFGEPYELRLDPVGAGLALVTSAGLLWFLRSGFAVSLLLLGLPVWRDLDLLPVVARGTPGAQADDDHDAEAGALLGAGTNETSLPAGTA